MKRFLYEAVRLRRETKLPRRSSEEQRNTGSSAGPALPSLQKRQVYFGREGGSRAGEDGLQVADGGLTHPSYLSMLSSYRLSLA